MHPISSLRPLGKPERESNLGELDRTVVVAVVAMRVVEVSIDEIVDVVTVRHGFVPASGAVNVVGVVPSTVVVRSAIGWVFVGHFEAVLVDMVAVWVMQVTVVKVIDVVSVDDRGVPAVFTVDVIVIVVLRAVVAHL
jgi:hypothetical protein